MAAHGAGSASSAPLRGDDDDADDAAALAGHDFTLIRRFGRGSFGHVHECMCRRSGARVAIKVISKRRTKAMGVVDRVVNEVALHTAVMHPNVLELMDYFEDGERVYLVTQPCDGGDLYRYLRTWGRLTVAEVRHVGRHIAAALAHMHRRGIMHRDLKLSNLLLMPRGGGGGGPGGRPIITACTVKVADFGLAAAFRARVPHGEEGGTGASSRLVEHHTLVGTPNYMAPEVVASAVQGPASDVYSLGCLLYCMAVGEPPLTQVAERDAAGRVQWRTMVSDRYESVLASTLPADLADVITKALAPVAADRLSAQEVLRHPFFASEGEGSYPTTSIDGTGVPRMAQAEDSVPPTKPGDGGAGGGDKRRGNADDGTGVAGPLPTTTILHANGSRRPSVNGTRHATPPSPAMAASSGSTSPSRPADGVGAGDQDIHWRPGYPLMLMEAPSIDGIALGHAAHTTAGKVFPEAAAPVRLDAESLVVPSITAHLRQGRHGHSAVGRAGTGVMNTSATAVTTSAYRAADGIDSDSDSDSEEARGGHNGLPVTAPPIGPTLPPRQLGGAVTASMPAQPQWSSPMPSERGSQATGWHAHGVDASFQASTISPLDGSTAHLSASLLLHNASFAGSRTSTSFQSLTSSVMQPSPHGSGGGAPAPTALPTLHASWLHAVPTTSHARTTARTARARDVPPLPPLSLGFTHHATFPSVLRCTMNLPAPTGGDTTGRPPPHVAVLLHRDADVGASIVVSRSGSTVTLSVQDTVSGGVGQGEGVPQQVTVCHPHGVPLFRGGTAALPPRFHRLYRLLASAVTTARRRLPAMSWMWQDGSTAALMDDGPSHTCMVAVRHTFGVWRVVMKMRRGVCMVTPPSRTRVHVVSLRAVAGEVGGWGGGGAADVTIPMTQSATLHTQAATMPPCLQRLVSWCMATYAALVSSYDTMTTTAAGTTLPIVITTPPVSQLSVPVCVGTGEPCTLCTPQCTTASTVAGVEGESHELVCAFTDGVDMRVTHVGRAVTIQCTASHGAVSGRPGVGRWIWEGDGGGWRDEGEGARMDGDASTGLPAAIKLRLRSMRRALGVQGRP